VDDILITTTNYAAASMNRLLLCYDQELTDSQHRLSVRTNVSTGHTFWFDYIDYVPSASVPMQSYMLIDNLDSAVTYGPGWKPLLDSASYTTTSGSECRLNFTGM
jgi:hypothetical protein